MMFRYKKSDFKEMWQSFFGDKGIVEVSEAWGTDRKGFIHEIGHMWDINRDVRRLPIPKKDFIGWVLWVVDNKE
jgi:hypothetical protein